MTVPQIKETSAMDTVWREAIFTHARLDAEALTQDLAPSFEGFAQRALEVHGEQRGCWKEEVLAQARVVTLDGVANAWCKQLEKDALRAFDLDRANKSFRLLFPAGVSKVTKQALVSKVEVMRGWPMILGEVPALAGHVAALTDLLAQADAAVKARVEADVKTSLHRLNRIEGLIRDLNAAREAAYADLLKLAATHDKPKGWARSFFSA